jgi:DNA repair exonuclease SbcCD ATPase subunit
MKKALLLLLPLVMFSCKDYDAQFDELTNMIASLEADNRALESQIAAVQAQDALIAQATSARLTEFAEGVSAALAQIGAGVTQIGAGVTQLGTGVTASVQMLQGIMASLSQLTTAIAANSLTVEEINAQLDTLEELLEKVEQDLEDHMSHTSGGSHTSGSN